jgi:hypothetical protein
VANRRGRIEGFREAADGMRSLSRQMQAATKRRILAVPGNMLADEVRARVPVFEQNLLRSIELVNVRLRRQRPTTTAIAVLEGDVASVPQEFGTSDHPPQPHFRPAIDAKVDAMISAGADATKREVDAALARVAARGARR